MKTFRRLTAMAFAMACALSAAPSFAATASNGINLNGIGFNGIGFNGIGFNGIGFNGINLNGIGFNGIGFNGIGFNGASKTFTHQLSQLASEPLL
jgi:hypothetical protein